MKGGPLPPSAMARPLLRPKRKQHDVQPALSRPMLRPKRKQPVCQPLPIGARADRLVPPMLGPPSGQNDLPKPALWAAVERKDAAAVQELLAQGHDPSGVYQGWTPLMKAAEQDDEVVLQMLLNKKVNMEATNNRGRTALSFAAVPSNSGDERRKTAVGAIRLLLENGADPKRKADNGRTPKEMAARGKRLEAVRIFEEFGH